MRKLSLLSLASLLVGALFVQESRAEEEKAILEGHILGVSSVAFSPDGTTLASSGGYDGTVRLWDVASRQQKAILEDYGAAVSSVAFSPDGTTLASASLDGTVRLWDVASQQEIAVLEGHTRDVSSVAFSPDGTTLASASYDDHGWNGTVRLWDVASQQEKAVLKGHTYGVSSVAFSPDGTTLAGGSGDDTVLLWDVASQQVKAILKDHRDDRFAVEPVPVPGEPVAVDLVVPPLFSSVWSVAFSPDGTTLASSSWDGTVLLWDVASQQEKAILRGHTLGVFSVAFSPDGTTLASGSDDHTVRLWNVASQQEIAVLEGHTDWVESVAFSPDGTTLASGSRDNTILLWDMSPYVILLTAVEATSPSLPSQTVLLANYPNPFNSHTQLAYRLAAPGPVRLAIYNALGQRVRTLVDGVQTAGEYQVAWDARDGQGAAVSSGVYLTRLLYPSGMQTRRLLLLK